MRSALGGVAARRWLSSRGGSGIPRINALETVAQVLTVHNDHQQQLRPIDVSACWNTLGKLVRRNREQRQWLRDALHEAPVLQPLLDTTLQKLPFFEPRAVANSAHGLAVVSLAAGRYAEDHAVWEELAVRGTQIVHDFNPMDVSNTVYAFAKTGHASPALFDAVAEAAPWQLHFFEPQTLANTVWAYATIAHPSPALFDAVAEVAPSRLRDFSPQDFSNTVWAYASMGHASPALFDAIAKLPPSWLRDFEPQALANMVWAYATIGHPSPALFDAVAEVRSAVAQM